MISAQAHCQAMQQCRPGLYEYELEAVLSTDDLINLQAAVDEVYVDPKIKDLNVIYS